MPIRIIDNSAEVQRQKDILVERALEMIGLQAEGHAKEELSKPKAHADGSMRPNVDTGRLRNSITHAVGSYRGAGTYSDDKGTMYADATARGTLDDETVYIGTNVEYAQAIEFGTSKASAYPFLKPAIQNHIDEYKRIAMSQLKKS